jgi:hypothetical protein
MKCDPLLHLNFLHPRFSVPQLSTIDTSCDAENGEPHGDRAVHAADLRSVLRLGAIYDPLRPARLESVGLFALAARTTIRTSDTPVVHRVSVVALSGITLGFVGAPKTAWSALSVKILAASIDPECLPSQLARGLAAGRPSKDQWGGGSDDRDRPLATSSEGCRRSTLSNVDRSSGLATGASIESLPFAHSVHSTLTCSVRPRG